MHDYTGIAPVCSVALPPTRLVTLEQQLAERLLDFERLDEAWPSGRTAIERAEIGRDASSLNHQAPRRLR